MTWRTRKFWLILLVGATCVGLLEGAQVYTGASALGRPLSWARALGSTMPSWYVLALLMPLIMWAARRFPLEPGRWQRSLMFHAIGAVLFTIVHVTAASWLSDYVLNTDGQMPWDFRVNLSRLLSVYFVIELFSYFALVGGVHAYEYGRRYRQRERDATRLELKTTKLEASLARANLDALRMQLNPHFLFNTLNAISVLSLKGERQAVARMLTLLSDLLRLSLERREQLVTLREELQFLDHYLEIEQVRFGDRLLVERSIEPETLDAEVPSLLLQPLVENAIRHGISRQPGTGSVRIEARITGGDTLEMRVLDTGIGLGEARTTPVSADSTDWDGTGVGLANTRARLVQLYGEDQSLVLADRDDGETGGAMVTIRVPFHIITDEFERSAAFDPLIGDDAVPADNVRPVETRATQLREKHA